jgi:hypothetical protein
VVRQQKFRKSEIIISYESERLDFYRFERMSSQPLLQRTGGAAAKRIALPVRVVSSSSSCTQNVLIAHFLDSIRNPKSSSPMKGNHPLTSDLPRPSLSSTQLRAID